MDEMDRIKQWSYYISSYMRIENTEGVPRSRLQKTLLLRNLPADAKDGASEDGYVPKPLAFHEDLVLRICLNSLKVVFEKNTSEYFIYNANNFESQEDRSFHEDKQVFQTELRTERLKEKMVMNNSWMKNMSQEEVQRVNEDYQKWVKDGIPPPRLPAAA
jgi:paired amphipathic helix protein Sin3a